MEPLRARGCVLALEILTVLLVMTLGAVRGITEAELLPFSDALPLPTGNDEERTRNFEFVYRGQLIELITVSYIRVTCDH